MGKNETTQKKYFLGSFHSDFRILDALQEEAQKNEESNAENPTALLWHGLFGKEATQET